MDQGHGWLLVGDTVGEDTIGGPGLLQDFFFLFDNDVRVLLIGVPFSNERITRAGCFGRREPHKLETKNTTFGRIFSFHRRGWGLTSLAKINFCS